MPTRTAPEHRALIEGVPSLAWGQGQDCTFAGALAAAMAVTEHPYPYAELMGLSGLAFRLRWCNDETATQWCPSCAVGELPDEYAVLTRLTGWWLPTDVQFGLEEPDRDAIREKVVAAIDAGQPVVAYASSLDMAVIYGYEEGGETLLVHDYGQPDPFRMPASEIGPMQTYLGDHTDPPSPREALTASLQITVGNWRREKHDGGVAGREYTYGDAAFKAWIADLERYDALDQETQDALLGLDGWVLTTLYDARQAAVTFLQEQAPTLGERGAAALRRAADDYQHVVDLLVPVLVIRAVIEDATGWTIAAREREIAALNEVYPFESKAIAAIEEAIVAADKAVAVAVPTAESSPKEARVILEGVDRYRVMDPMFEPVRVVLSYRGEPYSPAYIQGLSGGAFRIGGICPCAPTCACAMSTQDLLGLLGYGYTYLSLCEEGMDPEQEADAVIARVKDEVRAGRPAIVWHAFTTAEWDVVCGFDEGNGTFFGRGSYAGLDGYAEADQRRTVTCTAICPPLGAILVGERASPLEAREAEIASLREAVQHAHSRENVDKADSGDWVMLYGLACYDRWACDFQAGPPRLPTMGDRYCFGVYRSTHRAAAGYLRELAVKYPEASTHLERGAMQFAAEADALHACAEMLFPDWQLPQEADADLNARAAGLLAQARDHYAGGIDAVEAALGQID
jgi:hypothetical protein